MIQRLINKRKHRCSVSGVTRDANAVPVTLSCVTLSFYTFPGRIPCAQWFDNGLIRARFINNGKVGFIYFGKTQTEANKKHIKNLSNKEPTDDQTNLLAKGHKFIPTPVTNQTQIRRQLLRDFSMYCTQGECVYNTYSTGKTINHILSM